ncbi:MHS family MFS transporter [Hankyongella ginsenosidimutans]|uniref:MHS family MFS transporter n=1 Tax=Hankyongella ginsenosidimutans TaxID=1763828 RepID=A0A4D7C1W8_9SPHN|nr:MHS family MFS transporter [Hankyongella ginsenosidimutans]
MGLFLALLVVIAARSVLGEDTFKDWGWRIPFLVSIILLGISVWIRLMLDESPLFKR